MDIIETNYIWRGALSPFSQSVRYIVLHHAAAKGSAEAVHLYHRDTMGWLGIAYHLYVRQDGSVWRGRPMDKVGAHVGNLNSCSIGICFEGNFCNETMGDKQLQAGREAIAYAKSIYPGAKIVRHCELSATACPGDNFPVDELTAEKPLTGAVPEWAKAELREATEMGITDGKNPTEPILRYEAAVMALRAMKKGMSL